jgi:hypothetical protein
MKRYSTSLVIREINANQNHSNGLGCSSVVEVCLALPYPALPKKRKKTHKAKQHYAIITSH